MPDARTTITLMMTTMIWRECRYYLVIFRTSAISVAAWKPSIDETGPLEADVAKQGVKLQLSSTGRIPLKTED